MALRDAAGQLLTSERLAAARRRANVLDEIEPRSQVCDQPRGNVAGFYRRPTAHWRVCTFCGLPQFDHAEAAPTRKRGGHGAFKRVA